MKREVSDKPNIEYFKRKMDIVLRDVGNYTNGELWREVNRILSGATNLANAEQLEQELEALKQEREWIPVGERLPEGIQGMKGIIIGRDKGVICSMSGVYFDGDFYATGVSGMKKAKDITHWMPLPPLPEESEK